MFSSPVRWRPGDTPHTPRNRSMKPVSVASVVGARPNFIKMAALMHEMEHRPQFTGRLIHTGQHFSPEMSDAFFRDLELPEPHYNLGIGGGTQTNRPPRSCAGWSPFFRKSGQISFSSSAMSTRPWPPPWWLAIGNPDCAR